MKTILVDDMLLDMQLFELKCADMPDFEIVGKFTNPPDIDIPGMNVMEPAKLFRYRQQRRYYFHTFGPFDMKMDVKLLRFRSGKAKGLMARCLYRQGCRVTIYEIVECLWGEEAADAPKKAGYRRTIKELADTHKDLDAEELPLRPRGSIRIKIKLCTSDYQALLRSDLKAHCQFKGRSRRVSIKGTQTAHPFTA